MKTRVSKKILAATIALPALGGAAWAGGADDFGCSIATLKGEYAFGGTNYTSLEVFNGIKVFDGNGNLTQRDYLGNSSPPEFSPAGQETGTYTVNPNCTGSMVISGALFPNHKHPVCDQRWRPSYPRSRFAAHPVGIDRTHIRPNQCRRLESRFGA